MDWGNVNRPFAPENFDRMHRKVLAHLAARDVFVADCYGGHDPQYRVRVRVVTENAWHALFARTMFIRVPFGEMPAISRITSTMMVPMNSLTGWNRAAEIHSSSSEE